MRKKWLYQFIKFGIVGTSNTLIAYAVYSFCVYSGIHYIIANVIAFFVSVLNAYFWSEKYIFKKENGEKRSVRNTILETYIAYGSTGLLLGSILLTIYVDILMISEYIAQLLDAFDSFKNCKDRPTFIVANTVKGKGVSYMEHNLKFHYSAPNEEEFKQAMKELR